MMKGKTVLAIAIGGIGGLLTGCNSDNTIDCPEDFTGALAENEQKLIGEWTLSAITADASIDLTDDNEANPLQDIYVQYTECQRDGVYQFDADRNYKFDQGRSTANCANESSSEGTWRLDAAALTLVGACNQQFIDVEFNEDASEFSFSEDFNVTDVDASTVRTEITFTYSNTQ